MTLPEAASSRWAVTEGLPFPLGPTKIEEEGVYNFALYSKHAESVTLLLYTEHDIVNPVFEYSFDYLKNKTGRVWHCRIPFVSMRGAFYYAYRVDGPAPNAGSNGTGSTATKSCSIPMQNQCSFPLLSTGSPPSGLVRTRARRLSVSLWATASASTGKATIVPDTRPIPSSTSCTSEALPGIPTPESRTKRAEHLRAWSRKSRT